MHLASTQGIWRKTTSLTSEALSIRQTPALRFPLTLPEMPVHGSLGLDQVLGRKAQHTCV